MKKAFSLVEVLVILFTVPIALLLVSHILVALLRDMPSDVRLLQQNTSVLDMTRRLAEDMDRAEALPASSGTLYSDAQTLLIQLPDAIACYRRIDDGVTRTLVGHAEADHTWHVPDATIDWQLWEREDHAYAVELRTHLQRQLGDQSLERFANAHVYFIDGIGKADEIE